jgi:nicotinamide riboside transporter PnuC
MIMNLVGWLASILSIFGVFLNARKNIWCWYIWIVSNIIWLIYYYDKKDFPAIVLWVAFTGFNVYGLIMWKKEKKK